MSDDELAPEPAVGGSPVPAASSDDATTRTFLIADIRGYTTYTREHGDEKAAELAGRFAAIVREVVAAHDGFLVELRGDEALVVFVSARRALRAAIELQARFTAEALPRGVGIGLDSGEAIPIEGGFRGTALNLAARLCGEAGPGQIVASEGVIHLAATVEGIAYVDPRTVRLKGYDEPVRAVTIVAADQAPKRTRRTARHARSQRRLLVAGGVAGLAVVLAAVGLSGAFGIGLGGSASPSPSGQAQASATPSASTTGLVGASAPSVVLLDSGTGELVKTVSSFKQPVEADYSDGSFWVLDLDPKAIHVIDAATGGAVGVATPIGVDEGTFLRDGRTMWLTGYQTPNLYRYDLTTGRLVDTYSLAADDEDTGGSGGIALGDGSLWISRDAEVLRVDPNDGTVESRIPVTWSGLLAFDGRSIWLMGWNGTIERIEPASNEVVASDHVVVGPAKLVVGGGYAWVSAPDQGNVYKLDDSINVVGTYQTGDGAGFIDYDDSTDTLWAGNFNDGTLSSVDGVTGDVQTLDVGYAVQPVAAGDGHLLIGLNEGPENVISEGSVVTLVGDEGFENTDPAYGFRGPARWQLDAATCARLLDYRDTSGPEGGELRPDVAAAMPEVSGDGRTYTFTIRPGFAFSPPSGEPLTADTYRYSIERALSPELGDLAFGYDYLSDVVGATEFHEGRADRLVGVEADGDQLIIRLTEPSPTILDRLWLAYFCPVPVDTPIVNGGVNSPPIPRAGPYYIDHGENYLVTILKRNPAYGGDRPGAIDNFVWWYSRNLGREIGRVDRGERDYVAGIAPELIPGGPIDDRLGAGAAEADRRLFHQPTSFTYFLVLDGRDGLLADPAVREAIGRALDRPAFLEPYGSRPTDELLPGLMPGAIDADRYPLDGPDEDRARALMANRTGSLRVAWGGADDDPSHRRVIDSVTRSLAAIGLTIEVVQAGDVPPAIAASEPGSDFDIVESYAFLDYADPGAWLEGALRPDSAPPGWIPAWASDELGRIKRLTGAERYDAAGKLAGRLVDEGWIIPYGTPGFGQLVSERLGCVTFQPRVLELDLAALCLEEGS